MAWNRLQTFFNAHHSTIVAGLAKEHSSLPMEESASGKVMD